MIPFMKTMLVIFIVISVLTFLDADNLKQQILFSVVPICTILGYILIEKLA